MLDLARRNATDAGAENVEFLKGYIEDVPLPDAIVDVIISNCVINLSADKLAVFQEMRRRAQAGRPDRISDIVASDDLSPAVRAERGSLVGCIAGALSFDECRSVWRVRGSARSRSSPLTTSRTACTRRSSGRADPDRMTAMPEPNDVPEVLFVCVHNAGRSQMAAALPEHHAGGRVRVRSAGTTPSDEIHPNVVEAMAERGSTSPRLGRRASARTTSVRSRRSSPSGCGDACPVVPETRYLDWDLPNPAGIADRRGPTDPRRDRTSVLDLLRELAEQ